MTPIEIRGARTHNLKDIDVDVPKRRLVAFTGVSGSGKSSLVFDTICTEAQRQLVETFSTYARRRLPQLSRPPVDTIRNISPCIVIDQKRLGASSRSTVGTVTEVYTHLRMLFSRCGRPFVGWSHRFSFNHPDGMCPACKAGGWTVGRLVDCELTELDRVLEDLVARDDYEPIRDVVATLVARMRGTLRHLIDIGVGYLSLNRGVPTLSGGESQRVKMAWQLDCDLVDLIYILDEPTVGLYPRDIDHLIVMLHRLRDHGNSVLVVEHDPAVIRAADWIVDIGPRAGDGGGELVFCGPLDDLLRTDTATSRALNDQAAPPSRSRRTFDDAFRIENATSNNLRNLSVRIPKGVLTCVTGVAGSGKSSLVAELIDTLRRRPDGGGRSGEVVVVDQRPVGRSSRSNPAGRRRRRLPAPRPVAVHPLWRRSSAPQARLRADPDRQRLRHGRADHRPPPGRHRPPARHRRPAHRGQ